MSFITTYERMSYRAIVASISGAVLVCAPLFSFAQYGGYGHGHGNHGNGHGYGHDGDHDDDDDDWNNGHGDDHGNDDDDHGNGHGNGNGNGNNGNHGGWKPGKIYKENKRKPVVVWHYGHNRSQLRNDVLNFKIACSPSNNKNNASNKNDNKGNKNNNQKSNKITRR